MKVSDVFNNGKSLKASDLQGRRVPVTIDDVRLKKFDDGSKLVMTFRNSDKALMLNKTNANMIAEIAGSEDTDMWAGKRIVLVPAKTDFQGRRVDCIRVDYPEVQVPAPQHVPVTRAVVDPVRAQPRPFDGEPDFEEPPF